MKINKLKILCTSIIIVLLIRETGFSQASLAAEDILENVKVKIGNIEETFTIIRDARERNQWYYVPERPHLFEKTQAGLKEPEFSLIRYQTPEQKSNKQENGMVQFTVSLQLPSEESVKALKNYIANLYPSADVKLAALPIKKASLSVYVPDEKGSNSFQLLENVVPQNIAPISSSLRFLVSINLNNEKLITEIINGKASFPVIVTYSFNGLTPQAGFRVTINYDQTYRYYIRNPEFRSQAYWLGLMGISQSSSSQDIYNKLINNKCIEVEIASAENFGFSKAHEFLQIILARINNELIAEMTLLPTISAAQLQVPATFSVAMKNTTERKTGKEMIDFSVQRVIEGTSIASGFIGIGTYPEEVRKRLVLTIDQKNNK